MKKSSLVFLLLSFTVLVFAQQKNVIKTQAQKPTEPQPMSSGKFTGMIFNDFFYIVQEPQTGNVSVGISGRNASVLRRAMLGYEYSYNKDISAKLVYDGTGNVLKQGYAEVKNIGPMMDLKLGLNQTLSSEIVEKIWDYRSLEATVLDKKGMTNEFDMGLTLTGRVNPQGTTYARLAVYNGSGLAIENDKLKKLALVIGNWFDKSSVIELYVDYENVGGGRSTLTGKVFYGMTAMKFTFGGEGFYRMNRKFAGTSDITPVGASLFGWYELMKSLRGVVRVDITDDNLDVSTTGYREVYLNAGVDYSPIPEVRLIPNLAYVKNLKKSTGTEIADDIMVRLTTAVYFK
ncbi:MAG: hypothetical protein WDA22_04435 [Bacteroidota bacterium]